MTEGSKRFIVKEKRPGRMSERGRGERSMRKGRGSMTLREKIYQVLNLTGIKYSKGTGLKKTNVSK